MSKTYHAQCHCGQVRITCQGEPYPVFMCNCELCQRRTGSPVHIGAWWPMEDVTMEGEDFPRNVLVEFASLEAAEACYNSPDYQEALAFAKRGGTRNLCIVEGV